MASTVTAPGGGRRLAALLLAAGAVGACGGGGAGGPQAQTAEWPRFRGPGGDGIYAEACAPLRWSADSDNIRWKTRIPGTGNSSPIVAGSRVYLTTAYGEPSDTYETVNQRGELTRAVLALDLASGEVLWEKPLYRDEKGAIHWLNTHAVPTPATDGELVFVSFESRLAALDRDGELVWDKNFDPDYVANSRYGASSSLALSQDAVILVRDREDGDGANPGFLVAVAKRTGEELWRHEWMETCCSYATPLVVRRGGREEVLHSASSEMISYDAATGERLWSAAHPLVQPVPSPLLAGDLLVSPGAVHSKALTVFRLSGEGAATRAEQVWQKSGQVPDIPSPLLLGETLLTLTESGLAAAYELETGKRRWRARLPAGSYLGSPVATAEHVYLPTAGGSTVVIDARAPEYRLLAENRLPDGSGASPALTRTCLLLRTASHLYCIGEEEEEEAERRAAR